VIAVYTHGWTDEQEAEKNRVISEIARAAWRHFAEPK
jgi:hypothetical protein